MAAMLLVLRFVLLCARGTSDIPDSRDDPHRCGSGSGLPHYGGDR